LLAVFFLRVLLYHIAALVLYGFPLMFMYWYICFACWALTNFTFSGPCILKCVPNKVIIKQAYHDARSRKCDPLAIRIQYTILCEASEYTQTSYLGTHHIRKNLSSRAETCVLGEIVWLVSCADRHCLQVVWSPVSCSGKNGWVKSPTSLPGIKLIRQVCSTCRCAAAGMVDSHCTTLRCPARYR